MRHLGIVRLPPSTEGMRTTVSRTVTVSFAGGLCALAIACAACSQPNDQPLAPALPALSATAEAQRTAATSSAAKIGEARELRFFSDFPETEAILVTVTRFELAHPGLVVELRIDNPTSWSVSRPDVNVYDSAGENIGAGHGGGFGGLTNIYEIDALPAGTYIEAGVYWQFDQPPATLDGCSVVVRTTGLVPEEANSATWTR